MLLASSQRACWCTYVHTCDKMRIQILRSYKHFFLFQSMKEKIQLWEVCAIFQNKIYSSALSVLNCSYSNENREIQRRETFRFLLEWDKIQQSAPLPHASPFVQNCSRFVLLCSKVLQNNAKKQEKKSSCLIASPTPSFLPPPALFQIYIYSSGSVPIVNKN